MILALRVCIAAWPDDDVTSSGMLRRRDRRGVISLGSWMTASDAGGAWLLATTKELANRTHVPYFFASRNRHSYSIARIPPCDQQTRWVRARQRTANVCEHSIECWIHSDSFTNKMLREWMNEWMNERTLRFLFSLREERLLCDGILLRGENYDANIVKFASNRCLLLAIEFFSII